MKKIVWVIIVVILFSATGSSLGVDPVMTFGPFTMLVKGTVSGSTAVYAKPVDGGTDLFSVNLATGDEKRLTQTSSIESNPFFAGGKIVFSVKTDNNAQSDLAMVDLEGNSSFISQMPGDESSFWVYSDWVLWVVDSSPQFSIWGYNLQSGTKKEIRGMSTEKPTHILSNGAKVFWSQQDDETDLDVWMADLTTGKSQTVCHEPGDQYCVSIEGDWVAIIGRYVFRPDRDLYCYSISQDMEIPVDTTRSDTTYAAISNGCIAYLSQPLGITTECQVYWAKLTGTELSTNLIARIPMTEKDRLVFSWPILAWEDKRDCYVKGTDIWCYDFNTEYSFPASLDAGDQYVLGINSSVISWLTARNGTYSLTFKTLTE